MKGGEGGRTDGVVVCRGDPGAVVDDLKGVKSVMLEADILGHVWHWDTYRDGGDVPMDVAPLTTESTTEKQCSALYPPCFHWLIGYSRSRWPTGPR